MRLRTDLVLALTVAVAGCRGDTSLNGHADASVLDHDAPLFDAPAGGTTIKAMLAKNPVFPQVVALEGVIVVAKRPTTATVGEFWVQDPGGGPSSGMHIYCNTASTSNPCPTAVADIEALKIGDVISVTGKFSNNNLSQHPLDDYEIIVPTVAKSGATATPTAMVVDAAKVAFDTYDSADFKTLHNTLVKVQGPLTVGSLSAKQFGTTSCSPKTDAGTGPDAGTLPTAYIFGLELKQGATILNLGFRYSGFTACALDCNICSANSQCSTCTADKQIQPNATFSSVQGILYGNYQASTKFVEIRPVSDADLVAGAPDTTPDAAPGSLPDAGAVVDASVVDAPLFVGTTIKEMLTAMPADKAAVAVANVIVVAKKAPASTSAELWVQDPGGGPSSGVHIYCNPTTSSNPCLTSLAEVAALKIGDVVNIAGKFNNNVFSSTPPIDDFEILGAAISKTGATATPTYYAIDAAKVAWDQVDSADVKSLLNVLVKVQGPFTVGALGDDQFGTTSCKGADAPVPVAHLFGFELKSGATVLDIGIRYPGFTTCMPDCDICSANAQCTGCTADKHLQASATFSSVQGILYGNYQGSGSTKTKFVEIRPVTDADLPQ